MKTDSRFLILFLVLLLDATSSYEIRPSRSKNNVPTTSPMASEARRAFLTGASSAVLATTILPRSARSADLKVTPLAHTFITSSGTAAKPIRENDATRFFTNAKVVYLLEGTGADPGLAAEVLDLTVKRKAGQGGGVTPGSVQVISSTTSSKALDAVVGATKAMPEGDVLIVGPIPSGGTAADGKLLADTAKALGTFVGGKTGRGVISVLLDGPREGLKLEEGGYPTSELLWYSLVPKS
jgi:hypothetical protein